MPTCLSIAGIDLPSDLDGDDLMAVAKDPTAANRLHIGNCSDQYYVVIQDQMKYHWFAEGGVSLLFDLAKDPLEQHNLSGQAAYVDQENALQAALIDHLSNHGSKRVSDGALNPAPMASTRVSRYPGFRAHPEAGLVQ